MDKKVINHLGSHSQWVDDKKKTFFVHLPSNTLFLQFLPWIIGRYLIREIFLLVICDVIKKKIVVMNPENACMYLPVLNT